MRVGFEVSCAQAKQNVSVYFLLPVDQDVGLSAPYPAPCVPCMAPYPTMMIMDQPSLT